MIDSVSTVVPGPQAQPTVGSIGERAFVPEVQLQMTCPPSLLEAVIAAMKRVHPYETPAYSVLADVGKQDTTYMGRMGRLPVSMDATSFAHHVKDVLGGGIRYAHMDKPIRRVAVCGGSGGDLWRDCVRLQADRCV